MTKPYSPKELRLVLIICALVTGVGFIDTTALNVAMPFIQTDLKASATDTYWVIEVYLLGLATLMMAAGALGDSLGRRRPLRWGVLAFALTSIGCALSTSASMLIFFRALQGISAALMVPASLALINASFAPEERGAAIGKWSALVSLTIPLGPLVGGIAVDLLSWQAVFWVNLPICLLVLWLMRDLRTPPYEPPETVPLDIKGSLAITIALGLITWALMEAGRQGAFGPAEWQLLAAGIFMIFVFLAIELKSKTPMIPPALLTNRRFVVVNLHTGLLFAGFQSSMFFLSFLLIQAYGYGATAAGAAALPVSVLVTLLSRKAGSWTSQYGPRGILAASSLLIAAAFYWVSFTDGDYWQSLFLPMVLLGFGVAGFAAPITTVAMVSAGAGRDGLASGVNNAVARIGPLLGIAALGYFMALDFEASMIANPLFTELPEFAQSHIIAHINELGGMTYPQDWPEAVRQQTSQLIASEFAATVKSSLNLCAFMMIGCLVLCFFYKKSDALE